MAWRKVTAVLAMATAGLLMSGTAAHAVESITPTTTVDHNLTICGVGKKGAGLEGDLLLAVNGSGNGDNLAGVVGTVTDGKFLTVTIADGVTVEGIVVKGGDGANIYVGPYVGATVVGPMQSPDTEGDTVPTISHWYVCGGTSDPDECEENPESEICDPEPCPEGDTSEECIPDPCPEQLEPCEPDPCDEASETPVPQVPGAVVIEDDCEETETTPATTEPSLPTTGVGLTSVIGGGVGLLAVGAAFVGAFFYLRRRRAAEEPTV